MAWRHDDLAIMQHVVHLYPPAGGHLRADVIAGGKIVAVGVELQALMNGGRRILPSFVIDEDLSTKQMHTIPRHSAHALHKMLLRMYWVAEHDDVAAMNG